jgi:hypothetical protein
MARTIRRHDPASQNKPVTEARQAVTLGHMRYVLAVSLLLAVLAGVFLFLAFFR